MASMQELKGRLRSVKSTKQITKAMQMVAASKMRRAQESAKASLEYANHANMLLSYFATQGITDNHPLFEKRDIKNRLIIAVASDKGLAGAYNSNILKEYLREHKKDADKGINTCVIAVGRRIGQTLARINEVEVVGSYEKLGDRPSSDELIAIRTSARELFLSGEVDAVDIIYTEFVSSIKQIPKIQRILPAGADREAEIDESIREAKYEPNARTILEKITTRLIGAQVYQAMLDARASEHSMRMMAMKNATDNATDLGHDLTLEMNKARQAAITQELSEISAGVEAMK